MLFLLGGFRPRKSADEQQSRDQDQRQVSLVCRMIASRQYDGVRKWTTCRILASAGRHVRSQQSKSEVHSNHGVLVASKEIDQTPKKITVKFFHNFENQSNK
ncbi:unnamed protein product [Trichogramma brassicae]|uniref:Uncharacterized protein n=1 Tax=Trichogramma brassicae TaxID=86971 RepID=A0A6H5I921_9HYME|nr:unnamed protein product [Trichogramma brassicae]